MLIEYPKGSPVELAFDKRLHSYKADDVIVPSATQVLGIISKPALVPWALKMGATWLERNMFYDDTSSSKGQGVFHTKGMGLDALIKGVKAAYKTKSGDALNIGNLTHEWLEKAIKWKLGEGDAPEKPTNEGVINAVDAFREWVKENDVKWISSEEKLYNRGHKYAGTVDAIAEINGEYCVIDWKTSRAIYPEYYLQVAAYAKAVEEMKGCTVDATYILRCDKTTGMFEAARSADPELSENFKAFLAAKFLFHRMKELK